MKLILSVQEAWEQNKEITMALIKEVTYKGITADYWKILSTPIDFVTGIAECIVGLYQDDASRLLDANNFIQAKRYSKISATDMSRADWYTYLKTQPDFSDAVDG